MHGVPRIGWVVVGVAVASSIVTGLPPAAAACVGPRIAVSPRSAAPGAAVTVHGEGFGDNCYDTGSPPPGQGVLGNPLADIEITFVQDSTTVLATVDADAEYEFTVEVTVPADAAPGPATFTTDPESFEVDDGGFTIIGSSAAPTPVPLLPAFTG